MAIKLPIEIITTDDGGLEAVSQLNEQIHNTETALNDIAASGSLDALGLETIEGALTRLQTLNAQMNVLENEMIAAQIAMSKLDESTPDYDKQAAALARKVDQYERLKKEVSDLPNKLKEAASYESQIGQLSGQLDVYGRAETSLRAVTGAIGFAGGGEIEKLANTVSEVLAVVEALPLLGKSLTEIGARLGTFGTNLMNMGGVIGTIAANGGAAVAALTGVSAGVGAVIAVAAPFVLAIGAAVAAMSLMNAENEKQARLTRHLIQVQGELYNTLVQGTQDDVEAKLESLELQRAALERQVGNQQAQFEQMTQDMSIAGARIVGEAGRALGDALNAGGMREYRENLQEAESNLTAVNMEISLYNQALNDSAVLARTNAVNLAQQAQVYADVNEALASGDMQGIVSDIEAATRSQENALTRIAQLEIAAAGATDEHALAIQQQIDAIRNGDLDAATSLLNEYGAALSSLGYDSAEALQAEIDATEARVNTLIRGATIQQQVADMVETASAQEFEARREQIAREIESTQDLIAGLRQYEDTSDSARQAIEQYENQLNDLTLEQEQLNDATLALISARESENATIEQQLSNIQQRIAFEQEAAALIRGGDVAGIDNRIQALEDERAAIRANIYELQVLAETNGSANEQLQNYNERLSDINDSLANLEGVRPEAALERQMQGLDELITSETDTTEKIEEIRAGFHERYQALEEKRAESVLKSHQRLNDSLASIRAQEQKALEKENQKYMSDSLKETSKFLLDEKRIIEDYNDERLQIVQDLHSNLQNAEENNDVVAFIRAQRAADKSLQQLEDTNDKEKKRRYEDFQARVKERIQEHEITIDEIQSQAKERREKEQDAHNKRLADIESAYQKENASIRNAMAERIEQERQALQMRQAEIMRQYGIEKDLIAQQGAERVRAAQVVQTMIMDIFSSLRQGAANLSYNMGSGATSSSGGRVSSTTRNSSSSSGGLSNWLTGGLNQNNGAFASASQSAAYGLANSGIGGSISQRNAGDTYNFNVDVSGDNVTLADVNRVVRGAAGQIIRGIREARS